MNPCSDNCTIFTSNYLAASIQSVRSLMSNLSSIRSFSSLESSFFRSGIHSSNVRRGTFVHKPGRRRKTFINPPKASSLTTWSEKIFKGRWGYWLRLLIDCRVRRKRSRKRIKVNKVKKSNRSQTVCNWSRRSKAL